MAELLARETPDFIPQEFLGADSMNSLSSVNQISKQVASEQLVALVETQSL